VANLAAMGLHVNGLHLGQSVDADVVEEDGILRLLNEADRALTHACRPWSGAQTLRCKPLVLASAGGTRVLRRYVVVCEPPTQTASGAPAGGTAQRASHRLVEDAMIDTRKRGFFRTAGLGSWLRVHHDGSVSETLLDPRTFGRAWSCRRRLVGLSGRGGTRLRSIPGGCSA
jgi:hypothetical protein